MIDAVRSETNTLKAKGATASSQALATTLECLLNKAEDLVENRQSYSDEAAQSLFASVERNLRVLMKADNAHQAQEKALAAITTKIGAESSPAEVQAAFKAAVDENASASEEEHERSYPPLKKLRTLRAAADSKASGGAGSSGAGVDDDDLGEDGFAVTQQVRATKCSLLILDFTASGDLRPVVGPCGHMFSYKGISQHLGKKKGQSQCPEFGCNRMITLGDFVDHKEYIKELKKREARDVD